MHSHTAIVVADARVPRATLVAAMTLTTGTGTGTTSGAGCGSENE
jgi:hypothetical protein